MEKLKTNEKVNFTQFELSKALLDSTMLGELELSPTTKLVLITLTTYYNPKNETLWPAQATLAKRLGISLKSVERAVKELKLQGLVLYETKNVNHYRFATKFFDFVKMSGWMRQNVEKRVRQNVAQTNNKEKNKKKDSFSYFKGGKSASWKEERGGMRVPNAEETRKLLESYKQPKEDNWDEIFAEYTVESAREYVRGIVPAMRRGPIIRGLVERFGLQNEFELPPVSVYANGVKVS